MEQSIKKNHVSGVCGKRFLKAYNLNRHKDIHSEENYNCTNCVKTFRTKLSLAEHETRICQGLLDNVQCVMNSFQVLEVC